MKRETRKLVKAEKDDARLCLKRLRDEYPFPTFQRMVYDLSGYVVKPHPDKCVLSLHKGLSINKLSKPMQKDGYEWSLAGTYRKKAAGFVNHKGFFTYNLFKKVAGITKTIKETSK